MAESHSHKFGQIIGDALEAAIEPLLREFADVNLLYLDKKGLRPTRGKKKKVSWKDLNGNKHDLDFVLERGGTSTQIGKPVAFIEAAWRRYTKHSRNKAQEIQGAILPLAATYKDNSPFIGTILAGEFTSGAIEQLKSLRFAVLYFPYQDIVASFATVGIDASFDEETPEDEFSTKIRQWRSLSDAKRQKVYSKLLQLNSGEVSQFMNTLKIMVNRTITKILILPLHGIVFECASMPEAVKFLEDYAVESVNSPLVRFEIEIEYNNGDKFSGSYVDKELALMFLNGYIPAS